MSKYKVGKPYPTTTDSLKRIWEDKARNYIKLYEKKISTNDEMLDWVDRESLRELANLQLGGYEIVDGGTKEDVMSAYDKVMEEYFDFDDPFAEPEFETPYQPVDEWQECPNK